jgi:Resolvase, N terminal domain
VRHDWTQNRDVAAANPTPSGKAMFGMLGVFAEFERAMIQERVKAGMARAKAEGKLGGSAEDRCRGRTVHSRSPVSGPRHHLDGEGAWRERQCCAAGQGVARERRQSRRRYSMAAQFPSALMSV